LCFFCVFGRKGREGGFGLDRSLGFLENPPLLLGPVILGDGDISIIDCVLDLPGRTGLVFAVSDGVSAVAALNGPDVVVSGEDRGDAVSSGDLEVWFALRRK